MTDNRDFLQLRPLGGRKLQAYLVIWSLLAIASLAALALGTIMTLREPMAATTIELGFSIDKAADADDWAVDAVGTDEAVAAGIRYGDKVTRLNGVGLAGMSQAQIAGILGKIPQGHVVAVETQRTNGATGTARLIRSQANYTTFFGGVIDQAHWRLFVVALTVLHGLAFFCIGVILLRKRTAVVPQMMAVSLLLPNFFLLDFLALGTGFFIAYAIIAGALAGILLNAFLVFPDGRYRGLSSAIVGIAAFVVWWLAVVAQELRGADSIWNLLQLVVLAAILWHMIQKYRSVGDDAMRQQFRWVMLGLGLCGICWAGGLLANWASYSIAASFPGEAFNTLHGSLRLANTALNLGGPIFIPLGILIALLRFRLYDVDLIIGRTSTYVATTALLAIGSFVVERAATFAGPRLLGSEIAGLSYGVAAAFASLFMGPLHERLVRWSDKKFQARLLSLRDDLPHTIRDMSYANSRDELLEATLARICHALHTDRAAFLSSDGREALKASGWGKDMVSAWAANRAWPMEQRRYLIDTDEAAFPFTLPLRAGEEAEPVLGWLVVGRRRDDTLINVDEREVLAGLSAPLARALMLIEARDEEKRVLADRFNQLERAVSAIMSRLTPPSHPPAAHP